MKIVVLDGATLNPGDLSWDSLERLGSLKVFERTDPSDITARCAGAQVILTNKAGLSRDRIHALPDLGFIGVTATGFNVVDIDACRERAVIVSNVPAYSTRSVAQLVFAHILEHCHNVGLHSNLVRRGQWAESKDFAFWKRPLIELDGLTLGIFGLGDIGLQVARIAQAFGMKVIATSRTPKSVPNVQMVGLEDLLAQSDFLTLHAPLTPVTERTIDAEALQKMKKSSFLINTSRGALIDEDDLAEALNSGQIAGAGLDVLTTEPPSPHNPLLAAENTFITPHIAWATRAARIRLMNETVENVRAWMSGSPRNVVS